MDLAGQPARRRGVQVSGGLPGCPAAQRHWPAEAAKPPDPKAALEGLRPRYRAEPVRARVLPGRVSARRSHLRAWPGRLICRPSVQGVTDDPRAGRVGASVAEPARASSTRPRLACRVTLAAAAGWKPGSYP